MTGSEWRNRYQPYGPRRLSRGVLPQKVVGGVVLTCFAFASAWILCTVLSWVSGDQAEAMQEAPAPRSDPAPAMFESRFYLSPGSAALARGPAPQWYNPVTLAALPHPVPIIQDTPASPQGRDLALHMPASAPRSADVRSGRQSKPPRDDSDQQAQTVANAPAEPTIFERIFGKRL